MKTSFRSVDSIFILFGCCQRLWTSSKEMRERHANSCASGEDDCTCDSGWCRLEETGGGRRAWKEQSDKSYLGGRGATCDPQEKKKSLLVPSPLFSPSFPLVPFLFYKVLGGYCCRILSAVKCPRAQSYFRCFTGGPQSDRKGVICFDFASHTKQSPSLI